MQLTTTLEQTEETKNYVKYEQGEDSELPDFTTIYLPQEQFEDTDDAPTEITLTVED